MLMKRYYELVNQIHRELCVIPAPSLHEDLRAAYCAEKLKAFGYDNVIVDEA